MLFALRLRTTGSILMKTAVTHSLSVGAPALLDARNFQDALYPNEQPCRSDPSATQTRCRVDAKHPEIRFRALLTGGGSELELTLA
jgi:hypothetical protein